jgi:AcrR family transcriptional regulator
MRCCGHKITTLTAGDVRRVKRESRVIKPDWHQSAFNTGAGSPKRLETDGRTGSMADDSTAKPRIRDAGATRARILAAAKKEFAESGLGGARVDVIALTAKANKRMIYHYFGSKEGLFQTVVETAYIAFRTAEQNLQLEHLDPRTALEQLVRFTWDYFLKNPEFITLVNSENLHRAKHLRASVAVREYNRRYVGMMAGLLDRGVRAGVFRPGIDPVQLNITVAAIAYYYLTNRFTGSIVFERDLMTKDALAARLDFNIDTVLRLVSV